MIDKPLMKYFKKEELACPCCGLFNLTDEMIIFIDTLRANLGEPIIINSGSRCEKHNKAVGGVPSSAHTKGLAVDIKTHSGPYRIRLIVAATKLGCRRIGISPLFTHLDLLPGPDSIWLY